MDSLDLAYLSLVKNGLNSDAISLALGSLDAYYELLKDRKDINDGVRGKIYKIVNEASAESRGMDKHVVAMCDVMRIRFGYFFEKKEKYILELRKIKEMTEQQNYDPQIQAIIAKQLDAIVKESERF